MGCASLSDYIKEERKKFVNGEADMAVIVKTGLCFIKMIPIKHL
jgi:hypothetical protein